MSNLAERFERVSAKDTVREAAMKRFLALGFPTTHDESWRYTNLAPLQKLVFVDEDAPPLADLPIELRAEAELVFVNGRFMPGLSTATFADDVTIASKAELSVRENDAFSSLSTAFALDGAAVHVRAKLATPIRLLHISDSRAGISMNHPRVQLVLDANTEATVIERFVTLGDNACFTNAQSEIRLGERASLKLVKWQDESAHAFHVAAMHVQQARASKLDVTTLSFGAKLGRTDIRCTLADESDTQLRGLLLSGAGQTQDVRTYMDHKEPRASSRQLFKAVLDKDGKSAYDGHIRVAPDAQKTNAAQKNQHLLLSKDAVAASKPHLEIYADDVKCAHGSTSGQLSTESLFYLRSRGINEMDAKALLTLGFAEEIISHAELIAEEAKLRVRQWLR